MAGALQDFEDAAHDLIAPLDRLVGIGIGADSDDLRHVVQVPTIRVRAIRRRSASPEQLHELEIEARRQSKIRMRRPGEAVNTAVLAAAIRIDRTIEGNVGRVVARNDPARRIERHVGLERRQVFQYLPAVIERDARERLISSRRVGHSTAAAPPLALNGGCRLARRQGGQRCRRAFQSGRSAAHGSDLGLP